MNSVDEIANPIRDAHAALQRFPNLPPSYTGLTALSKWVKTFETKKASDSLTPEEVRELKYDL